MGNDEQLLLGVRLMEWNVVGVLFMCLHLNYRKMPKVVGMLG